MGSKIFRNFFIWKPQEYFQAKIEIKNFPKTFCSHFLIKCKRGGQKPFLGEFSPISITKKSLKKSRNLKLSFKKRVGFNFRTCFTWLNWGERGDPWSIPWARARGECVPRRFSFPPIPPGMSAPSGYRTHFFFLLIRTDLIKIHIKPTNKHSQLIFT